VTEAPSNSPTAQPSVEPTKRPTLSPSKSPSSSPSSPFPSSPPSCSDDPCKLEFAEKTDISNSCDPIVLAIAEVDSWCGIKWDPWCVVTYNDCFELTQCDSDAIDEIAVAGNVDRTRIDCPANLSNAVVEIPNPVPPPVDSTEANATCPYDFPGTGTSCEATNLQCYYYLADPTSNSGSEWFCNCGADPMEFYCKPKDE